MQFDEMDTALIAVVALASAAMAGLATFSAFGVSLSDTQAFMGGSFSIAYLGTLGAFGATIATNDMALAPGDFAEDAREQLDDTYFYLLMGSVVLLVTWPFVSAIPSFVQSQDLWGVLFIAGSTGAQVAIGYMK
jgi:hypothetical protein